MNERAASAPAVGPVGRLGRWTVGHVRLVAAVWIVLTLALGIFAPRVEQALSGAGWWAVDSESVETRAAVDESFGGQGGYALTVVVQGEGDLGPALDEAAALLDSDPRVSGVSVHRSSSTR